MHPLMHKMAAPMLYILSFLGMIGWCVASGAHMTSNSERRHNEIHVAVMAEDKGMHSSPYVWTAVRLAEKRVKELQLLNDYTLVFSCHCNYDQNSTGEAQVDIVGAYQNKQVDAIIGPVRDYIVAVVSRYAHFWNIPILSTGGHAMEFDAMPNFNTLTRVGPVNFVTLSNMFLAILKLNHWNKIRFIYDRRAQNSVSSNFCFFEIATLYRILKNHGIQVDHMETSNPADLFERNDSNRYNVIGICASPEFVRELMIKAHEHDFDNGEYVFYNVDHFTNDLNPWYNASDTQERNEEAFKGFQALQTITLMKSESEMYYAFSNETKRRMKDTYANTEVGLDPVNRIVAAYHDAVILYAHVLNESLADNVSLPDGLSLTQRLRNRTFVDLGIDGLITINEKGRRLGQYRLYTMVPDTGLFQVQANYYGHCQQLEPLNHNPIYWPGKDALPPRPHIQSCPSGKLDCLSDDGVFITITPDTVNVGNTVEMTCTTEINKQILTMEILDEAEKTLVYVRGAESYLSLNSTDNHLNMTLTSTQLKDSGNYTCVVTYLDDTGTAKSNKHTAELSVRRSKYDVISLSERLDQLESMLSANNVTMNNCTCDTESTAVTNTTNDDNDLIERVDQLESQLQKMSNELEKLSNDRDSPMTAFHATFGDSMKFVRRGMTLTFSNIITQQGQGFDPQSGVFTAPTDGIYGFHLSIKNLGNGICMVALKADDRYFSLLTSGNIKNASQTSVSSVVDLKAGEKVKAVVIDVKGEVHLRGWSFSTFTGYLIKSS